MNILILNWRDIKNPKSGGAEIVTMEHAKRWVKKGHRVTWFTSGFKGAKKEESIENIEIIRRGNSLSVFFFAPIFYLFSNRKFDLVIDEIHGLPFFTPLYVRKPKVAFIHEVAKEIWDYMYPFPINKIGKFIESFYFGIYSNTKFWVPSESTLMELEKYGIKRTNCKVIVCGISNRVLSSPSKKEEKPTFIFVSRVVKMKGVEDVVKSFFNILMNAKDANLWIVGDGDKDYIESLKKTMNLYAISTKVKFFGRVSEQKKLELMRRAHLLLHASIKEGWGLVVVEAASQSTPSVVYNVSGLRDSVLDDKTGIVLKRNDSETMAEESLNLLKDKIRYKRYQEQCLKWAGSLSWDKPTKESLSLLQEVANG